MSRDLMSLPVGTLVRLWDGRLAEVSDWYQKDGPSIAFKIIGESVGIITTNFELVPPEEDPLLL